MPNARPISPRAPWLASGRSCASDSAASPRSTRWRLTAAARSGAVSTSVPSRSNSTRRTPRAFMSSLRPPAREHVVDVGVAAEREAAREWLIGHAFDFDHVELGRARCACEFARADEARVFVRAFRQELQDVFGADDGEQEGFEIAVDGREENPAAGPDESAACAHGARWVGDVFEQFHAGDDVEGGG